MRCCEPKGFLSLMVLWLIRQGKTTGAEISSELEKRKGSKPSPGTIYPVLKKLSEKKLIVLKDKKYELTKEGQKELQEQLDYFFDTFHDVEDMKKCSYRTN